MKKLTLLTAVALSCFAVSSASAQIQVLRAGTPTPAPRLVSDQTSLSEAQPLPLAPNSAETTSNPFDFFDKELPQVEPQVEPQAEVSQSDLQSASPSNQTLTNDQETESDPASLPVGRRHRHNGPSVVDTIVSQATLGNIANASVTPVNWGGNMQTPNPVAEWLLREECVEGLWANYPQQRAKECATMWSKLAGPCGGCSSGTCAQGVAPCTTCAVQNAPRNRYLDRLSAPPMGCNTCAQAAPSVSCAPCDSCQQIGGPAPGCSQCAVKAQQLQQLQMGQATGQTNVANLPPLGIFR